MKILHLLLCTKNWILCESWMNGNECDCCCHCELFWIIKKVQKILGNHSIKDFYKEWKYFWSIYLMIILISGNWKLENDLTWNSYYLFHFSCLKKKSLCVKQSSFHMLHALNPFNLFRRTSDGSINGQMIRSLTQNHAWVVTNQRMIGETQDSEFPLLLLFPNSIAIM